MTDRQLQVSEQTLQDILDSMQDTYYRTDDKGLVILVSRSVQELLGVSVAEILGSRLADYYLEPDGRDKFLKELNYCGGIVSDYRAPLRHKDGHAVWVSTNAHYLRDEYGQIAGIEGTTRNITAQKEAEDKNALLQRQLRQAQKMEAIGQLTGGLAHDFNNILTSILGYAGLGKAQYRDEEREKLRDYFQHIINSGERARDLISNMLTFSRGSSSEHTSVDPAQLFEEMEPMLRAVIPASISFGIKVHDLKHAWSGDPGQLQQVIMNLCINAKDAMLGVGRIDIDVREVELDNRECASCHELFSGNYIVCSVRDIGPGVGADIAGLIFDPFFSTKDTGKGSGMGLSMVHGIVHDHKGHVSLHSSPRGSEFSFLLPAVAKPADKKSEQRVGGKAGDNAKASATVMVVDDEAAIVKLISEMLRRAGYSVVSETSSNQALKLFEENPQKFDLLISDQTMPELTGTDLVQRIKALRQDLPVLICSGYSEKINTANFENFDVSEFIEKPVGMSRLLEAVSRALLSHNEPADV